MSGKAGEATLTVKALANENYEDRSAVISIKSGGVTQSVPVYQKKKNALILSKEIFEVSQRGGSIDLEVKSNIEFEVDILDDWITQNQTRALTTHYLQFDVAANPNFENREGKIVIKDRTSDLADTVYVYQSQQNSLVLTQREYAVSELGETIDVVLKSNVDFTVQMPTVDWIEEVQTKSLQTYKYQFRVLPNETYDGREAQIIFKDNHSMMADTVFVYQTTKDALLLTKDRYEVEIQGGTIDVEVKSNIDFEVNILNDWITPVQTKGLETYYLFFQIAANTDAEARVGVPRKGYIVVADRNSSLSDTIYIEQKGIVLDLDAIAQDSAALIALYNATNGANWTNNTNWCSEKPMSQWYGVSVDEGGNAKGRVTSLILAENNLTGTLPEEIGHLTALRSFDVSRNQLSGTLPEGVASIMSCGPSLFKISQNVFSGSLPSAVLQHPNWKIHWTEILNQDRDKGGKFDLSNVEIPAPDFTVTDLNGLTLSSATEYSRNKYTVFYHWATWCPFSLDFTVKLTPLYKAYQSKGLEIIGYSDVSLSSSPHDDLVAVREYIDRLNIPWRNFAWNQDENNVIEAFRAAMYTPFVAVADQTGHIVFQSVTEDYAKLLEFLSERLGEVEVEDPALYASTDFSADGQVVSLQQASVGNGIDLVLMGDAFVDTTMVENGIYEQRMREGMEAFFQEEPMKSLRDRFNVYMVKVVSENGNYQEGSNTALSCYIGSGTHVGGSDGRCFGYASRVPGIDLTRAQVVVIMNVRHYAGTCYMYEDNSSVAYFPLGYDESIFDQLLHHEAVGHGFGKLLDEYSNNLGELPSDERDSYQWMKDLGWGANADVTSDPNQIRWAHFLRDSRYANEVGIYEGALTYQAGAWRPTENSIMRYNTGGFNAPSREALYKRVMELSGEGYSWEQFVAYDAVNRSVTKTLRPQGGVRPVIPLHAPIMIRGSWRNAQ